MAEELNKLQRLERAARGRYSTNGSTNDRAELVAELLETARRVFDRDDEPLHLGRVMCDCICNCGSIVCTIRLPRKGTSDTLCMTCLELSNRNDPAHKPWPVSGVVILPPEK